MQKRVEIAKDRLYRTEQENKVLNRKIEGFANVVKYTPKEFSLLVTQAEEVRKQVERMTQPTRTQSWDLSR